MLNWDLPPNMLSGRADLRALTSVGRAPSPAAFDFRKPGIHAARLTSPKINPKGVGQECPTHMGSKVVQGSIYRPGSGVEKCGFSWYN